MKIMMKYALCILKIKRTQPGVMFSAKSKRINKCKPSYSEMYLQKLLDYIAFDSKTSLTNKLYSIVYSKSFVTSVFVTTENM